MELRWKADDIRDGWKNGRARSFLAICMTTRASPRRWMGVVYGTGPFSDPLRLCDDIWERADQLGFNVDMFTAEYDSPQFEMTLTFDEAVKAVDDIVLFCQMAREVALEHGVVLTFLPKPIAEAGGSGMRINFSFGDKDGNNALDNGPIAGLMHHHRGLAGLLAPTANSYQRMQPRPPIRQRLRCCRRRCWGAEAVCVGVDGNWRWL